MISTQTSEVSKLPTCSKLVYTGSSCNESQSAAPESHSAESARVNDRTSFYQYLHNGIVYTSKHYALNLCHVCISQ